MLSRKVYVVVENEWRNPELPYRIVAVMSSKKKAWATMKAAKPEFTHWIQIWTVD